MPGRRDKGFRRSDRPRMHHSLTSYCLLYSLLGVVFPLTLPSHVWAQEAWCRNVAEVKERVARSLQEPSSKDSPNLDAIATCGSSSVQPLSSLLSDPDVRIRRRTIIFLGNIEGEKKDAVPALRQALKDQDAEVRGRAAIALGKIGEGSKAALPELQALLKDKDVLVRRSAASALRRISPKEAMPALRQALKDQDAGVRGRAAVALGRIGAEAEAALPDLQPLLKDSSGKVRANAIEALGRIGTKEAVPPLRQALQDQDAKVRASALRSLDRIGVEAKDALPDLQVLLKDSNPKVRVSAVEALGEMGIEAKAVLPDLQALLKDSNPKVRRRVMYAFGRIFGKAAVPTLRQALQDEDEEVRGSAIDALGEIGAEAKDAVPDLQTLLKDQNSEVRGSAIDALGEIGAEAKTALPSLTVLLEAQSAIAGQQHSNPYGWDSSGEDVADALGRIGFDLQKRKDQLSNADLNQVVQDLEKALKVLEQRKDQKGVEKQISDIQAYLTALREEQQSRFGEIITKNFSVGWLAHSAFWFTLIFAYPKSPQIQAVFFWNPWVRNVLGLGYVTFLLAWVPLLRHKLFEPFRFSLLADAGLNFFNPETYFSESNVKELDAVDEQQILQVIPEIKGQVILEGDSGLGKTMFLRHLLQQSKRIVVYLPATKCAEGVIEAIQKKLHGDEIKDTKFLQSLIYSGAIDICIDGLNEVNPDTRAKITQFVESHFKGNILMTTQPLEWLPPSTAKTYVMQPLQSAQIERYLLSRQPSLPKTAPLQGKDYEQACRTFLSTMLSDQTPLSPEELKTARTVLSNPMELTLAAWMLAGGVQPDLFNLREQQYKLMAEEYRRTWNQDFPLKQFAEAVYQQWLVDQKGLPADKFYNELLCMEDEKFRMVVSRQWKDAKGEAKKEWYFRHDKIAEFFLVQTFLGKGADAETRLLDHIGDSRFRGVYFLLATLMDLEAAKDLREKLIQYAADTKDHTVSDTFVQLLRSR